MHETHVCGHAGGVEVKGKGMMHTYIWDPAVHGLESKHQQQRQQQQQQQQPGVAGEYEAELRLDEEMEAALAHARAQRSCSRRHTLHAGGLLESELGSRRCVSARVYVYMCCVCMPVCARASACACWRALTCCAVCSSVVELCSSAGWTNATPKVQGQRPYFAADSP